MRSSGVKKNFFLLAITFSALSLFAGLKPVELDSDRILFKGARYIYRDAGQIEPLRFSKQVLDLGGPVLNFNPQVARMAAGVRMFFATDSSEVAINLTLKPFRQKSQAIVRVYRDDELFRDFKFARIAENDNPVSLTLESRDGEIHRYRIDLPATAETVITGLSIDEKSELQPIVLDSKPVYVALGDSITHGSGNLNGVYEDAYIYLLAQKLGCDFFNLGVNGGRVAPKAGEMLADWGKIDLITVLLGANDFSWAAVPPERYGRTYESLLAAIRAIHPHVPLFCITLTYTTREAGDSGDPTEAYREVVREIVRTARAGGDEHIFLIEGAELTGPEDLADWVHLTTDGNRRFAEKLHQKITEASEF